MANNPDNGLNVQILCDDYWPNPNIGNFDEEMNGDWLLNFFRISCSCHDEMECFCGRLVPGASLLVVITALNDHMEQILS